MPDHVRYAIYFVPDQASALYRFGARILGYDSYGGGELPQPAAFDAATWPAIVGEPRQYGFHATLKAPFRLAADRHEADLVAALSGAAATIAPVQAGDMAVSELGRFIAITPFAPCPAIGQLAEKCVRQFDAFRAPLTESERARRLAAGLLPRQTELLDQWGYPFVLEQFRFHMTLSGPLADDKRGKILAILQQLFAHELPDRNLVIDRMALLRQSDPAERFQVIASAELKG